MVKLQENDVFAQRYLLKALLDFHGTSEVWAAEDMQELGTTVAIRIFAPLTALDTLTLNLLKKDFDSLPAIDHPHLVPVHRTDFYNGTPYLVMPYLPHGSLNRRLQEQQALSEREVAEVLKQIGSALVYLHAFDPPLFHQNITPADILTDAQGDYLLSDYGISTHTRYALHRSAGQPTTLATAYTLPSQATYQPDSHKAGDVFSLGVALYTLCTGEKPFLSSTETKIPSLPASYPKGLSNILQACMHPDWKQRPTPQQLEAAGAYYLENGTWKTSSRWGLGGGYRLKVSRKALLAALAILVVLGAAAFFLYFKKQSPDDTVAATAGLSGAAYGVTAPAQTDTAGKAPATPAPEVKESARSAQPAAVATAPPEEVEEAPVTPPPTPKEVPVPAKKEKKPASTKPATLEGYLSQLMKTEVPIAARERWKPDVLQYFAPDAAIYCVMDNTPLGRMDPGELVDILLSADSTSTVTIDSTRVNDSGKVEKLNLKVVSGQPLPVE
ncbi:serine/threonine protein kinase [Pontibacter chitinilyticus]|uniref:serine/threonine protein kinase n=1 Tax=Pontibacter chitinilyticus TaxID=2674989 RepID=UPI00321B349E